MRSELHGEVKAFVEQVVEAMGLDVAVEVSDLEDGSVRVDVQGEEGELLLRRKGEGLDALQHLVNSAYRRDVGRDQRIVIDAMNFRQGKDIELRGAPWIGWIHDLSRHDPYYVTPILMGASQFWQTKMMPPTGDPAQQRMMMFMPLMFMVFFLWAPSGLVLYWLCSNLWTIGQQYFTNRLVANGQPAKAR